MKTGNLEADKGRWARGRIVTPPREEALVRLGKLRRSGLFIVSEKPSIFPNWVQKQSSRLCFCTQFGIGFCGAVTINRPLLRSFPRWTREPGRCHYAPVCGAYLDTTTKQVANVANLQYGRQPVCVTRESRRAGARTT